MMKDFTKENERKLEEARSLAAVLDALRGVPPLPEKLPTPGEMWLSIREKERAESRIRSARKAKKEGKVLGKDRRTREGRTRMHWATKLKRRRERYHDKVAPQALRKKAQLIDSDGWYPIVCAQWKKHRFDIQLTREEWDTHIVPTLHKEGCDLTKCKHGCLIPFTRRYNKYDTVISLDRILIIPKGSKSPVFDGKEWKLQQLGYAV